MLVFSLYHEMRPVELVDVEFFRAQLGVECSRADPSRLVDWTGAMHGFVVPVERVLFAPVQWLSEEHVKLCCAGVDCDMVNEP